MENTALPEIGLSLPVLKAKKIELEGALTQIVDAINVLEKLEKSGLFPKQNANTQTPLFDHADKQNKFAEMSIYEGAIALLTEKKQVLTTDEIVRGIIAGGKEINGNARVVVATTLYKSVRKKKNSKIAPAGAGKWKLV